MTLVSRCPPSGAALLTFCLVALFLTGPALLGHAALGPDQLLDWDPLYRTGPAPAAFPRQGDYTPIVIDYPRDLAVARGLAAGRLDNWNPLSGCGAPLWAEQGGPFFPLKLPFYLAPSRSTYNLFLALRLVLAAFGAFLLARAQRLGTVAAIAAGASFEVSGALIANLSFGAASPIHVLPWVVLGAVTVARRPTARSSAAAGLALGVAASGGHPTLALLDFIAFAAAIAAHLLSAPAAGLFSAPAAGLFSAPAAGLFSAPAAGLFSARAAGLVALPRRSSAMAAVAGSAALAVAIGLALAGPTLLPLAELGFHGVTYKRGPVGDAIREQMLSQARVGFPLALFAPRFIGRVYPILTSMHPFAPAVGVLTLTASLAGFLRRGLDRALLGVLLFGLAFSLEPPGLGWMRLVPGLSLILPTYAGTLTALVLTQAAGHGVQAVSEGRSRILALALAIVLAVGAAALFLGGWLTPLSLVTAYALVGLAAPGGSWNLLFPVALAAVAVAFTGAMTLAGARLRRAAAPLVASLMIIDQMTAMLPVAREPPSEVLSETPSPATRFLQARIAAGDSRMMGLPTLTGHPLTPMLFSLPDLRGVSALPVRRYRDYVDAVSPRSSSFTVQQVKVATSPLLDVASVRYLAIARPDAPETGYRRLLQPPDLPNERDAYVEVAHRDPRIEVYENHAALPRFRIVHDTVPVADAEAALAWLSSAAVGDHAYRGVLDHAVALEPDVHGIAAPTSSGPARPGDWVLVSGQDDPDVLRLEAHLETPGFVVIADTFYPGWNATVDGAPASIFPANLLFRAVHVGEGTHTVELRYEPRSFQIGVLMFGAGIVLILILLWRSRAG